MTHAILRFDGGCRPRNPGHAAFCSVVKIGDEDYIIARYIGIKTNNEAEYYGLVVGIKYAHFLKATSIEIISDSQLVVNQVLGKYRVKDHKLKPLASEAVKLLKSLFPEAHHIRWEKRTNNKQADSHCTSALNYGRNLNPLVPQSIKARRPGAERDPFAARSGQRAKFHARDLTMMLKEIAAADANDK